MRIFIAEKRVAGQILLDAQLLRPQDIVIYTLGLGLWRYVRPNISFKDIPYTEPPQEELPNPHAFQRRGKQPVSLVHADDLSVLFSFSSSGRLNQSLDSMIRMLQSKLPDCEQIITVVDQDRRGAYGATQLLKRLNPFLTIPVRVVTLMAYTAACFKDAFDVQPESDWQSSGFQRLSEEQHIKRVFEYWWHANATFVFGELCRYAGLKADPVLSKYELMAIFITKDLPSTFKDIQLHERMERHKGSGLYPLPKHTEGIGSCTSRGEIITTMHLRGYLQNNKDGTYSVSQQGARLLMLLSKRSFDTDLPFRLNEWMHHGDLDAARRYIRTFFGRQLRYQRKQALTLQA